MSAHQRVEPHIEGLRAVAVLAVVLHHAWPSWLPGGFTGVDVFFVISGYLIGKHLIEDIRQERFSFRRFYAARMRRLFPALAVVLTATWCMGWSCLDAPEFAQLGRHTLAAVTFSNNFLLWQEAGYFDTQALAKPLRHLWSLAIEEQFCLLLPALLWWGRRGGHAGVAWVVGLGVGSLAAFLVLAPFDPEATFYLLPTRLWELAAGVGVAAFELRKPARPRAAVAQGLAFAATIALAWGLLASNPVEWSALAMVLPVAGTALLLALPATTWLHRGLGLRPLVFIGGISYPLYLWHWPVLVFWRLMHPASPPLETGLLLLATIALAWLTKIGVEDPVRFGRLGARLVRPPALAGVLGALTFAGTLGVATTLADGVPSRLPPDTQALAQWQEDDVVPAWRVDTCFFWQNTSQPFAPECSPARRPGVAQVLLWGDSHAAHLYAGLSALQGQDHGPGSATAFAITQWTAGSCPPTDGLVVGEGRHCAQRRADALRQLTALAPDTAILAGAWARYVGDNEAVAPLAATVSRTLLDLRRRGIPRIVLVGPGPTWPATLRADLMRHMVRHRPDHLPLRWGQVDATTRALDRALRAAAADAGAHYLSMLDLLCDASGCLTHTDTPGPGLDLLFRDQDHLTRSGSLLVAQRARTILLGPTPPARSETIPQWIPTLSSRPS